MTRDLFAELVRLRQAGTPCVLATVVRTSGSTPRKAAARMVVLGDGTLVGTIGGGRVEKEVTEAAQALLAEGAGARARLVRFHLTHELAMCCGGEMEIFLEPMVPEPPLVVCGAGHVAHALVPLARRCGFAPIVVDEAEEMATVERFPEAVRIVDSFDVRDWKDVPLDDNCYVVIVTRDHAQDQALLETLIGRELAYLGLIGSRRKIEMFKQRLIARGVAEERFARLRAPIGLDIGAETPEEIAVAIVAELIQTRAARRPVRARAGRAAADVAGALKGDAAGALKGDAAGADKGDAAGAGDAATIGEKRAAVRMAADGRRAGNTIGGLGADEAVAEAQRARDAAGAHSGGEAADARAVCGGGEVDDAAEGGEREGRR